jgi:protease-4
MTTSYRSRVGAIGATLTKVRNFVLNTLFVLFTALIIAALVASCERISVPRDSALVLNPRGVIVEQANFVDPLQNLLAGGSSLHEVELDGLLKAVNYAATDDDIKLLILDLDELNYAAPAHTARIGVALRKFRESGKKVIAYGHFFAQHQYHIASFASALYMHPQGQVILEGYGGHNFYFKDLLDKLDVNVHVFRVGTYKAAVEPYLRNDMSADSRMASEVLYNNLWQHTIDDIAANRKLPVTDVKAYSDQFAKKVQAAQGDLARTALESLLVDELLTRDQARVRIADEVGFSDDNDGEINGINFEAYLQARALQSTLSFDDNKIAVLTAQGVIVNNGFGGNVVSAEPTIKLIRQAKLDPSVKALVLRVDSPGGSQFASELIRQELELLQLAGKPVVASFGAVSASGGYWISATADRIVAEPTTITGSIGIFSFLTTFEKTLANVGVHTDGVETTPLTLGMNPFAGINETMQEVLQASVEHGYEQFINLVARGRNLDIEQVKEIAEGRVWSGEVAHELGLVDQLGGLQSALEQAAELANLATWSAVELAPPVDPRAAIVAQLMGQTTTSLAPRLTDKLMQMSRLLAQFDDPRDIYVLCESCQLNRLSWFR